MERQQAKSAASQLQTNTLESLSDRVNTFLTQNLHKMKSMHFENRNTVFYHSCCNAFTSSRNKKSEGHSKRVTMFEFFGKEGKALDLESALKVCCEQSQSLEGSRYLSTPTFNTQHQEDALLAKRVREAGQRAIESASQMVKRVSELETKVAAQELEIQALKKKATDEEERAERHLHECIVYAEWLRYNRIDPQKVRELWYPPKDHVAQKITVGWPDYRSAHLPVSSLLPKWAQ